MPPFLHVFLQLLRAFRSFSLKGVDNVSPGATLQCQVPGQHPTLQKTLSPVPPPRADAGSRAPEAAATLTSPASRAVTHNRARVSEMRVPIGGSGTASPDAPSRSPDSQDRRSLIRCTEQGKQIPMGNGGITNRYWWTQTLGEATVYVDLRVSASEPAVSMSPSKCRAKDLEVSISASHLRVAVSSFKGSDSTPDSFSRVLLDGALDGVVRSSESMWTVDENSVGSIQ